MKPDYKNWIPKGMMFSLIAGTALSLALLLVFGVFGIEVGGKLRVALAAVICAFPARKPAYTTPTAMPSGMLCRVTASTIMVLRPSLLFGPSA